LLLQNGGSAKSLVARVVGRGIDVDWPGGVIVARLAKLIEAGWEPEPLPVNCEYHRATFRHPDENCPACEAGEPDDVPADFDDETGF
jgi:hypothetical protein